MTNKLSFVEKVNNWYDNRQDRVYFTLSIIYFIAIQILYLFLIPMSSGFMFILLVMVSLALLFRLLVFFYRMGEIHTKHDYELK